MTTENVARDTPKGMIVIATLLSVVSIDSLFPETMDDGLVVAWTALLSSEPVLATLTLATICAGVITAVGLWSAQRWALWSYLIWFGIFFGFTVASDSKVEPVLWKALIGALLFATLPGIGAVYLFRAYKTL